MKEHPAFPASLAELHPDRFTQPFWSAATEHRLVVPRCSVCDRSRMPPGPFCTGCGEMPLRWHDACGDATVHTFTVVRQAFHPDLEPAIPFVIAVVALHDHPDVRLLTNVVGVDVDDVTVGMAVRVWWHDVDDHTTIPRFAPPETTQPQHRS